MDQKEFEDILDEHTTRKYSIDYGERGYFNHMSHGLLALKHLDADKNRIQKFVDWYRDVEKLEKPEAYPKQLEIPECADLSEFLGERKYFYALVGHYERLLKVEYEGDMVAALRGEFPRLAPGMACSEFHGLIHLGYGFEGKNARIFSEGLAILHHRYIAMATPEDNLLKPLGIPGDLDLLDVLQCVKKDEELTQFLTETADNLQGPLAEKYEHQFSRRTALLLLMRSEDIVKYSDRIHMPVCYRRVQAGDLGGVKGLCQWLVDSAITMYALSERTNDFFFIHGVTSSWSLHHLMCAIENVEDVIKFTRVFMCGVIITYIVQRCPAVGEEFALTEKTDCENFWEDAVSEALKQDLDVHIYKLVMVCKARSDSNKHGKMEHIYRAAVRSVLDTPLSW